MSLDKIASWANAQRGRLIEDISALVRIPSVASAPQGAYPYGENCARALNAALAMAERDGFVTQNHEYRCGSAILPGRTDEELAICVHLDVVPAHSGWTNLPFEPRVRDGWLFGRGSADNKGACAAALCVLRGLREHAAPLKHTLRLIYGCDEEAGMTDMAYYLARHKPPAFALVPDAGFPAAYAEKAVIDAEFVCLLGDGLIAFDAGDSADCLPAHARAVVGGVTPEQAAARLSGRPEIAVTWDERGVALEARGVTAHAATPEKGVSAAALLARALLDAGLCQDGANRALAWIAAFERPDGSALGIACADEVSGPLSASGCIIRAQEGFLRHRFNARVPVTVRVEEVWERLCQSAQSMGWRADACQFKPSNWVPKSHPAVRLLTKYAREIYGETLEPYAMNGGTYAKQFPNAVAAGFGLPGQKKPCADGRGGGHQPDECVSLTNLQNGIAIYMRTIAELDALL